MAKEKAKARAKAKAKVKASVIEERCAGKRFDGPVFRFLLDLCCICLSGNERLKFTWIWLHLWM